MTKRYALKGINDDENTCAVCGKVELKRVMWLVELDADGNEFGEAFHVGTTCGAKLLGYSHSKVSTAIKRYPYKAMEARRLLAASHPAMIEYERSIREAQAKKLDWKARKAAGLFERWAELQAEANAWAEAQPVLVEL